MNTIAKGNMNRDKRDAKPGDKDYDHQKYGNDCRHQARSKPIYPRVDVERGPNLGQWGEMYEAINKALRGLPLNRFSWAKAQAIASTLGIEEEPGTPPRTINLNDQIRFKITKYGEAYLERLNQTSPVYKQYPKTFEKDADGFSTAQIWEIANIFGPEMYNGCNPPIETTIELK